MPCPKCENILNSFREKPFFSVDNDTYECPKCGQRWWCYNTYFHLWTYVDDDETWTNILNGCPKAVIVGRPARNAGKGLVPL